MSGFNGKLSRSSFTNAPVTDTAFSSVPGVKFVRPEAGSLSRGRILVMDDEKLVLDTLGKMISGLGYDVTLTASGEETVLLYKEAREKGRPFDCVIMDLTIAGGIGAEDVIRILREYDSSVTAIISSGYPDDPVVSGFREYGFAGVSVKPYTLDQLSTLLDEVVSRN